MYNKCETEDGEPFGHPDAVIEDFLYQVPVTFYSGLAIVPGDVLLDSQGLILAWRFADCQWDHWVRPSAISGQALRVQLESAPDYIGGQYMIFRVGGGPWTVIYTKDDEVNYYDTLCDAIESTPSDFNHYMIPVQGYR